MKIEFSDNVPLSYQDLVALNAMLLQSQKVAAANAISWAPSNGAPTESQKFIELPSPYPHDQKTEDKPKEEHKEEHHDWLHDACDWVSGTIDVATQVAAGAVHEVVEAVTEHPLETAVMIAEGVAIGAVVIAAAPVAAALGAGAATVGAITLTADAAIVGMTATGAVKAGGDVLDAASASEVSADILMHKSEHSAEEIEAARQDVQHKTGKAALEVAATVVAARSIGGSVDRLAAATEKIFPSTDKVFALPAPEKVLALPAPEKVLALPAPEKVLPLTDQVVSIPRPELPDGSAPQLLQSFDEVLASRQAEVNVLDLVKKLKAAQGTEEEVGLSQQFDKEMQIRRDLMGDVANQHASRLFPDRVVPTLKVEYLPESYSTLAGYKTGELFVKNSKLLEPSYNRATYERGEVANLFTHEMTHAEQDGLNLRNWIEIVTKGDTSGRALTPSEIAEIQELGWSKTRYQYSKEMIEDVNAKRPAELLSPSDVRRAELLEESKTARAEAEDAHNSAKQMQKNMEREYNKLMADKTYPPEYFSEPYLTKAFGEYGPPPAIEELAKQFDQLPKAENGYSLEQRLFAVQNRVSMLEALRAEDMRLSRLVLDNGAEYKSWFHELEAFSVGGQAEEQIFNQALSAR